MQLESQHTVGPTLKSKMRATAQLRAGSSNATAMAAQSHGGGRRAKHRAAANSTNCGSGSGLPSNMGTPGPYCHFCRWCCDCNANDYMDCEMSTVMVDDYGGENSGAVVFCSTCESSCSNCPAFSNMTLCPDGDCCNDDLKHQPPFNATYR
mmetsp:Transcript_54823/g.102837  ORF Transcript_54823/g.102837 Transcript_54823/m.102837 type:complete len:151 (-) Transcript_54823:69-521(-)